VTAPDQDAKAELRARVLAARRSVDPVERERAASLMTRALLGLPEVGSARCVAAYLSFGTEPSTAELLAALRSRGVRVLLPVLRRDFDLDWALDDDAHGTTRGERGLPGLLEPAGPTLGVDALARADLVVVPALAVGADGTRLGRGRGCYDRALVRVPVGRPVLALLYDRELLPAVPAQDHDRRVDLVVQPAGAHRFGPTGTGQT